MKTVVIDGQGGRLGQMIVEAICKEELPVDLYAVGTNSIATSAMLKAGALQGATGENPVIVACRDADVIIGPIAIVSADSLLGEITPAMALAVSQSDARKLLIPVSRCNIQVVGTVDKPMNDYINEICDYLSAEE